MDFRRFSIVELLQCDNLWRENAIILCSDFKTRELLYYSSFREAQRMEVKKNAIRLVSVLGIKRRPHREASMSVIY